VKHFDTITLHEAVVTAVEKAKRKEGSRRVLLTEALGCILAKDIIAKKNLPSFDNSAMDGFAFRHKEAGRTLCVAKSIFAGEVPEPILKENECYKIMTGAQIPSDVDTVVPIEQCTEVTQESVTIPAEIKKGSNFRKKGEEVSVGDVLLETGTILRAAEIALLSAQGIVAVEVVIPLRIAIVSTGDEIREPWEEASEDEIYNANAFGITALLKKYGFSPTYIGSIPDDLQKSTAFISSLKCYDVVITTGGISMGEADFLEEAFVANGLEVLFHGVNVKPGRPTMMGKMGESGETFVMAMPGNPMTTLLNIFLLSIPILRKLQGNSNPRHPVIKAPISQTLRFKSSRTNLVLGQMREGVFHVTRDNKIGSGMLTPLMESNAVAVFGEGLGEVAEGERVEVILF
jgi:molybdopterin molybdotransferase